MGWSRGSGWGGARQQGWTLGQSAASLSVANLFAVTLQPANAMAAALAALSFVPDLNIDKDRDATGPWSLRSAGLGSGKTATTDSTSGTAIPTTWSGYSGTDRTVAYSLKKNPRVFNEVVFTTDGSGTGTFAHGLDAAVSIGAVDFKSTTAVGPWRSYHRGLGGSLYLVKNSTAGQAAASNWFVVSGANVTVTGLPASATVVAQIYAHDTAVDGVIQCGSFTTDGSGSATVTLGWRPQYLLYKISSTTGFWTVLDTARGWGAGVDAALYPNATNAEDVSTDDGAPSSTGFTLANVQPSATGVYLPIRAVGG